MSKLSFIRTIPSTVITTIKGHRVAALIIAAAVIASAATISVATITSNETPAATTRQATAEKTTRESDVKSASATAVTDGTDASGSTTVPATPAATPAVSRATHATTPSSSKPAPTPAPAGSPKFGTIAPPNYKPPVNTTPIQVKSVSISLGASSCMYGTQSWAYSYSIILNGGATNNSFAARWEYQFPPEQPASDNGPSLPTFPLSALPTSAHAVSDNIATYNGLFALTFSDYLARVHITAPNDVYSGWVTVPRNASCR